MDPQILGSMDHVKLIFSKCLLRVQFSTKEGEEKDRPPIWPLLILLGSAFLAAINMEMNDCGYIMVRFIYKNRW